MDDEMDLLQRARERDPAALEEIYDRYAGPIYGYVRSYVSDREVAEDLAAEVFVRMLEALDKSRFARISLRAWLYRIAHNLVVDHYRSRRPTLALLEPTIAESDNPEEILDRKQLLDAVRRSLLELTPEQQQVLALRFGHKMKAREVAQAVGKTEDAVRSLQRRALASLRRLLEKKR